MRTIWENSSILRPGVSAWLIGELEKSRAVGLSVVMAGRWNSAGWGVSQSKTGDAGRLRSKALEARILIPGTGVAGGQLPLGGFSDDGMADGSRISHLSGWEFRHAHS